MKPKLANSDRSCDSQLSIAIPTAKDNKLIEKKFIFTALEVSVPNWLACPVALGLVARQCLKAGACRTVHLITWKQKRERERVQVPFKGLPPSFSSAPV